MPYGTGALAGTTKPSGKNVGNGKLAKTVQRYNSEEGKTNYSNGKQ